MKIALTERQRFALFVQLNAHPCTSHADQRNLHRVWTALSLDPIAIRCEDVAVAKISDFTEAGATEYELTSTERDDLIGFLDPTPQRPQLGGMSRVLYPIRSELMRSRDGGDDSR